MKTPICDFVNEYAKSAAARLHMPGHKGKAFVGAESLDITEIGGADVLYSGDGIIAESQKNASALFGTAKTLYSTEGSSLCIRAMLKLATESRGGERPWILAARNAHKAFLSACALLDIDVEWMYPKDRKSLLCCRIDAPCAERGIKARKTKPAAVYVTSPDYLGNTCDVGELARVCHENGVILIVDNAHGAYLNFLPTNRHPIALGADMCCDSAHKTLPVLTGGAYLHISKNAPAHLADGAEQAMQLFASTSPSYLILQSLDMANAYLDGGYRQSLAATCRRAEALKQRFAFAGYELAGDEPLKLTVAPKSRGYTGYGIADILLQNGVVCEFADPDFCVMMLTPELAENDVQRVETALLDIPARDPICEKPPIPRQSQAAMSIRQAMLSSSTEADASHSCGAVLATPCVSCPPAIPVLMPGEIIDGAAIKCFEYYGIDRVRVIK